MTQRPQDGHHFDLLLLPRDADGCRGIETSLDRRPIGRAFMLCARKGEGAKKGRLKELELLTACG
uniref:Uncharacterized protein n=1 Tax=Picea glauca TaxID=3330 RepID=A0A101M1R9_PICGL|nr:hypothetical protein ABT39_MTgene3871 [Picea glauca]